MRRPLQGLIPARLRPERSFLREVGGRVLSPFACLPRLLCDARQRSRRRPVRYYGCGIRW